MLMPAVWFWTLAYSYHWYCGCYFSAFLVLLRFVTKHKYPFYTSWCSILFGCKAVCYMHNVSHESQSNYKIKMNQPANAMAGAVSVSAPCMLASLLFPCFPTSLAGKREWRAEWFVYVPVLKGFVPMSKSRQAYFASADSHRSHICIGREGRSCLCDCSTIESSKTCKPHVKST